MPPLPAVFVQPPTVPTEDARFVADLMTAARAHAEAYAQRADFILARLVERMGLKLGLLGLIRLRPGSPAPEALHARRVGTMSPAELGVMHAYYQDMTAVPDPALAASVGLMVSHPNAIAARRVDLVPDAEWYASDNIRRCRTPGGVDDELLTSAPSPASGPGVYSAMSLHRAIGAPPFTARDRDLAYLVQVCVLWLFEDLALEEEGDALIAGLSPGRARVLIRLLMGDSAKQAAIACGSSANAINQQVKALHRHFKVTSRGELLSRCIALRLSADRLRAAAQSPGRVAFPVEDDPDFRPPEPAKLTPHRRTKPAAKTAAKPRRR